VFICRSRPLVPSRCRPAERAPGELVAEQQRPMRGGFPDFDDGRTQSRADTRLVIFASSETRSEEVQCSGDPVMVPVSFVARAAPLVAVGCCARRSVTDKPANTMHLPGQSTALSAKDHCKGISTFPSNIA
jgi:hypothetical protein